MALLITWMVVVYWLPSVSSSAFFLKKGLPAARKIVLYLTNAGPVSAGRGRGAAAELRNPLRGEHGLKWRVRSQRRAPISSSSNRGSTSSLRSLASSLRRASLKSESAIGFRPLLSRSGCSRSVASSGHSVRPSGAVWDGLAVASLTKCHSRRDVVVTP